MASNHIKRLVTSYRDLTSRMAKSEKLNHAILNNMIRTEEMIPVLFSAVSDDPQNVNTLMNLFHSHTACEDHEIDEKLNDITEFIDKIKTIQWFKRVEATQRIIINRQHNGDKEKVDVAMREWRESIVGSATPQWSENGKEYGD